MTLRRTTAVLMLILLASARGAHAHRVNAEAIVGDDGSIRVEAWLSGSRTPPNGTVIVRLPDGAEVARGELREGAFLFRPERRERFMFDVQLGEGHAKRIELSDEQVASLGGSAAATAPSAKPPPPRATARGEAGDLGLRVVAGLALIAALTALGMVFSVRRRLAKLEGGRGGGNT